MAGIISSIDPFPRASLCAIQISETEMCTTFTGFQLIILIFSLMSFTLQHLTVYIIMIQFSSSLFHDCTLFIFTCSGAVQRW